MNRRNKNKAAAKPSETLKQAPPAPPLAKPTPSLGSIPSSSTKPTQTQPARSTPPTLTKLSAAPTATKSQRLRQEWKNFELWLSARQADRDKRLSERLKELMSAKGRSRLQQQPADLASYENTLNTELAEQARVEWLKRLGGRRIERGRLGGHHCRRDESC